jgi:DnaJ-class molecular chaperone
MELHEAIEQSERVLRINRVEFHPPLSAETDVLHILLCTVIDNQKTIMKEMLEKKTTVVCSYCKGTGMMRHGADHICMCSTCQGRGRLNP